MCYPGVIQHHQDLQHKTRDTNAVCCDMQYVYIINFDPRVLSVHNWEATHLCDFDLSQLKIDIGHYLWAAHAMGDNKIMLATGLMGLIQTLHCYEIM